jgi:predicted membrane protein
MKMSATLIIGLILILLGLSAILKVIFNVDFPIFKLAVAAFFIYIGIRLLTNGTFGFHCDKADENSVIFGERTVTNVEDGKEYNVIFGSAVYNLDTVVLEPGKNKHIKLNTIFGGSKLVISKNLPVKINSNTVFGGTSMPNGNNNAFGESQYRTDTLTNDSLTHLIIEANTVFGGLKVVKN